ncbi:antA/AntB antirepressor family protein [Azotobacter vinelandii]
MQTRFNDWIGRRIEQYGFIEGEDFYSVLSKSAGGRPSQDYHLTLDMAKELAMVENNEKGPADPPLLHRHGARGAREPGGDLPQRRPAARHPPAGAQAARAAQGGNFPGHPPDPLCTALPALPSTGHSSAFARKRGAQQA